MKVADLVYDAIKPLFTGDIRLVEVEYAKKQDGMHLCVYIDKDTGVNIEDCVAVNHLIDETLEDLNPTEDAPYVLDVSSYGLNRPLKYDWQFKRYNNQKVNVKLYRKVGDLKEFVAVLKEKTDKAIVVEVDGENKQFELTDVAYVTPYIEF